MFGDPLQEQTWEARKRYFQAEATLMEKLTHGQRPLILYIGDADSRVMPSRVLGAEPGDVFVMRNIANIIPPADAGHPLVGAVLEYAVYHLQVEHIVVCGNTLCGGIQELGLPPDAREPGLAAWLEYARPAQERVPEGLKGFARLAATVEANVLLQVEHLRTYTCIQEAEAKAKLRIHPWVYDVRSGRVRTYDEIAGIFLEEAPFEETE
jgi:carbonic anhydrase